MWAQAAPHEGSRGQAGLVAWRTLFCTHSIFEISLPSRRAKIVVNSMNSVLEDSQKRSTVGMEGRTVLLKIWAGAAATKKDRAARCPERAGTEPPAPAPEVNFAVC